MGKTVKHNYALIKKIEGFPSWVINGKIIIGVQILRELSDLTGFKQ